MIDMGPEALRTRLKHASELSDLRSAHRLRAKVDYSPAAVRARLLQAEQSRRACLRLGTALPKTAPSSDA